MFIGGLTLIMLSWGAYADSKVSLEKIDCSKDPIYCQIIKNLPKINRAYAMQLSNVIFKISKKYDIPSNLFTAILMQESGYRLEAQGKTCGISEDNTKQCVLTDFGIAQIHYKTVEVYEFDTQRLLNDLEYSVEAGAMVLSYFQRQFKDDPNWFTRYNCGMRGDTERKTCQVYKAMVERYLAQN